MIREKYMAMGQQTFPNITARFLQCLEDKEEFQALNDGIMLSADKKILEGGLVYPSCMRPVVGGVWL